MRIAITVLAAAALLVSGCADSVGKTPAEKEFRKLYQDYAERFHEKMVGEAERMEPLMVTAEAARLWKTVFADHADLIYQRQKEILADLGDAPTIDEGLYNPVGKATRAEEKDKEKEKEAEERKIVLKQLVWNAPAAAQFFLNNWLGALMNPDSFARRNLLIANAPVEWEVVRRDVDNPILMQRQGPLVFIVELKRTEDHYQFQEIRWLRPISMGPLTPPTPPTPPPPPEKPGEPPAPGAGLDQPPAGLPPAGTVPAPEKTAPETPPAG